uniref:Uncharacterized protein n=1 Tax=Sinocyclocheilus anshuiensis TaxID=1608454 RepID=A0A671MU48_9TELE
MKVSTGDRCKLINTDGLLPTSHSPAQIQGLLSVFLLVLNPMEHTYCSSTLKEYHAQAQLINLPSRINERSVAAWSYEKNIDLDRVPQIIYEANCLNSHSCKGVDSSFSLESIPIAIKMPFL